MTQSYPSCADTSFEFRSLTRALVVRLPLQESMYKVIYKQAHSLQTLNPTLVLQALILIPGS